MPPSLFQYIILDADNGDYHCHLCDKRLKNRTDSIISKHIRSTDHHKSLILFQKDFTMINQENVQCTTCNSEISWSEVKEHGKSHDILPWSKPHLVLYLNNISMMPSQEYYCHLCGVKCSDWSDVVSHMNQENHSQLRSKNPHFARLVSKTDNNTDWVYHKLSMNFITFMGASKFNCLSCSFEIPNLKDVFVHIDTKEHVESKKRLLPQNSQSQKGKLEVPEKCKWMIKPYGLEVLENSIYCARCKKYMKNRGAVRSHLESHNIRLKKAEEKFEQLESLEKPRKEEEENEIEEGSSSQPTTASVPLILLDVPAYLLAKDVFGTDPEKLQDLKLCSLLTVCKDNNYCLLCSAEISNDVQEMYEHWRSHDGIYKELENNPGFLEGGAGVPGLDLLFEYISNTFSCNLCGESLVDFHGHVLKEEHVKRKKTQIEKSKKLYRTVSFQHTSNWYNIEEFCCFLCENRIFQSVERFIQHMNSTTHIDAIGNFTGTFDSCIPCGLLWIGKDDVYANHKNSQEHCNRIDMNYPVHELPKEARDSCLSLGRSTDELFALSEAVFQSDFERLNDLRGRLEEAVKDHFPMGKAHLFGPRIIGLAFPESEVDVFFDLGNSYLKDLDCEDQLGIFSKVLLNTNQENDNDMWKSRNIEVCNWMQTMNVQDLVTGLNCKIAFRNGLDVERTKLLRSYCEAYPNCRKMILFLKKWMSNCKLSGAGKITNDAISWYVIFYLQNMEILPPVARLIAEQNQSQIISAWETGVADRISANQTELTLKDLLAGFFAFYSEFDYKCDVACPLTGSTLKKLSFADLGRLPAEMEPYLRKLQDSVDPEFFCIDSAMGLQDPFDLSCNLTKAIEKSMVNRFKLSCIQSVELL